jgi:hypothetical protein
VGIVDKWPFPNKGSGRSVNEANDEHDPLGCPYSAKIAPTNIEDWSISRVDDFQLKESIPIEVRIRNRRFLSVT